MPSLYSPQYLKQLCQTYRLTPRTQYGQHYLIDPAVIEKIIEASQLTLADAVIEVGPGFGVLTFELTLHAGQVLAFEIEQKLKPYWEKQQKKHTNLTIIWGNVLHQLGAKKMPVSSGEDVSSVLPPQYKVIANLPYQITSPLIRLFLEQKVLPSELVLMVQKEVAERLAASPGQMSLLSVAVQYYANVEYLFTVPRTAFWPEPRVDSAVVKIIPHLIERVEPQVEHDFFALVKAGFSSRRKILLKNLAGFLGKAQRPLLSAIFSELNLSPLVRAQELSLEQWKKIAFRLSDAKK